MGVASVLVGDTVPVKLTDRPWLLLLTLMYTLRAFGSENTIVRVLLFAVDDSFSWRGLLASPVYSCRSIWVASGGT